MRATCSHFYIYDEKHFHISYNIRKGGISLKKLLLAAALFIGGASTVTTTPIDADAKTISVSALKQYKPSTTYTYTYRTTIHGTSSTYKLKYNKSKKAFVQPNSNKVSLFYSASKDQFFIANYDELVLWIDTPVKPGKITKISDVGSTHKFKVVSTTKKVTVGGKTYKNVLVVKNLNDATTFYIAKNRGIILEKNSKTGFKEALIKVTKS